MNHTRRLAAVRRLMLKSGIDSILITHLADVRWLVGFTGSSATLAVTRRAARLFTDGRYTVQAAAEVKAAKVEIVPGAPSIAATQWLAVQPGVAQVAFDAAHTTVAALNRIQSELPAKLRRKLLQPLAEPIIEPLRWLKDEDELAILRRAATLGTKLFDHILTVIRPGITEVKVAAELEYKARLLGAEGMSFETIAASGARSALPHGRATENKLPRKGFLTLDFGVVLDGYCSDMTRTVFLGNPSPRERAVYEAVLAAEENAIAAVKAGVTAGSVDEAARGLLRSVGLADAFTHSTGHGVGLEIHEGPRIGTEQATKLAPGMVITIEPGVYFPGEFGIRIEDMVAVTRAGAEVLTSAAPKALIQF